MKPSYVLAKDHLQRAASILQGSDSRTRQLRYIIERTIVLINEAEDDDAPAQVINNVLEISRFRDHRAGMD
ncbi:MAG: hypothetical protein P0Y65_04385 [Candidatus Devosia phytovorans]|uniref:Uncharacterized protein n=1 Tax=Candidatus Devosia phytovorans TaxID=3121372 RepID=A0AAJ5VV72_9HYPH|nr:hypothetical protein [Devosia sp.]WEK05501.1 MAG: hypothetical protein P0Y65_04385 [Devosia sp.]